MPTEASNMESYHSESEEKFIDKSGNKWEYAAQ